GAYTFPRLLPATYDVTTSLPGFRTSRAAALRLLPGTYIRQDFTLQIASVNTMMEVSVAAAPMFMASQASVGEVLPQARIQDLPLVGNNVLDLLAVLPGIQPANRINPDLIGEIRL